MSTDLVNKDNFQNYMDYAKELSALVKNLAEKNKIDDTLFTSFETNISSMNKVKSLHTKPTGKGNDLLTAYMKIYRNVVLGIVKYIMKQRDESTQEGDYFKQLVQELQLIVAGLLDQAAPSRPTSAAI